MEGAFRKIDVDALDEDVLRPEDLYEPFHLDPSSATQQAQSTEQQVRQLVSRGDSTNALQLALQNAPYGSDSYSSAKNTSLNSVLFVILQTPTASVDSLLSALQPQEQDTLMKYIYKGMSSPQEGSAGNSQCAALLAWHARLSALGGVGCIGRAMTDHRRV